MLLLTCQWKAPHTTHGGAFPSRSASCPCGYKKTGDIKQNFPVICGYFINTSPKAVGFFSSPKCRRYYSCSIGVQQQSSIYVAAASSSQQQQQQHQHQVRRGEDMSNSSQMRELGGLVDNLYLTSKNRQQSGREAASGGGSTPPRSRKPKVSNSIVEFQRRV